MRQDFQPHFFLAIPVSEEVTTALNNWVQRNKEILPFKTWVHSLDYHITLAFLGKSSEEKLALVKENIETIVLRHQSFSLKLHDIDVFGRKTAPRILWAGVEDNAFLSKLQQNIYEACQGIGYQLDQKKFNPHITLARRWTSENALTLEIHEKITNDLQRYAVSWLVDKVNLYQSHFDRLPKYEIKEQFQLQ